MNNTLERLEDYFWEYFPHEIAWNELKEINLELYNELQKIGHTLVLNGRLSPSYMGRNYEK